MEWSVNHVARRASDRSNSADEALDVAKAWAVTRKAWTHFGLVTLAEVAKPPEMLKPTPMAKIGKQSSGFPGLEGTARADRWHLGTERPFRAVP